MLDDVAGALDTASSMLGGPGQGPAAGDAPTSFTNGDDLGWAKEGEEGAFQKNDLNVADKGERIEFIHFGVVHLDDSEHFHHNDLPDTIYPDNDKKARIEEGQNSRAIMFRAALEREALLLNFLAHGCQEVLKDYEASKGGIGDMVNMASDLIGGGGGGSKGKGANDVNPIFEKIKSAITPVDATTIEYKKTHQAGIDLNQARSNYEALRKAVREQLLNPPKQDGLLGQVGGIAESVGSAVNSALGPLGDILSLIQGIAFKAFDVYLLLYLNISEEQEPKIVEATRRMTVEAITKNSTPIFPVWFAKPEVPDTPSSSVATNTGVGFVDDATKTADDVKKDAESAYKDVQDFFDIAEKDCPGTPFVDQAFGSSPLPPPSAQAVEVAKPQKTVADLVVNAFTDALKLKNMPEFVKDIMSEIIAMDAEFVRAMYQKLMQWDQSVAIPPKALYEAARKRLLQKLVNLLISQVSILQTAKGAGSNIFGVQASAGNLLDKGEDELNKEVLDKLDPALAFVMGNIAALLEAARKEGAAHKCSTMEVYLGTFPWVLALLFRDTFLPFWDLFVDNTFGQLDSLKGAVQGAKDAAKAARDSVDQARDYATKAKNVKDRWDKEGLQAGTGPQNLSGYQQDLQSGASRGQDGWKQDDAMYTFPIATRKETGNGKKIEEDEWQAVKPNEKWNLGVVAGPPGSAAPGSAAAGPSLPAPPSLPSAPATPAF